DDGPYGEGARVACRGARRTRGRSVPARAIGGRAGRARGGATAVLRGTHARARKIVSLMGADAIPHRAPRAVRAVALSRGAAGRSTRRAQHDAVVGPGCPGGPGGRPVDARGPGGAG